MDIVVIEASAKRIAALASFLPEKSKRDFILEATTILKMIEAPESRVVRFPSNDLEVLLKRILNSDTSNIDIPALSDRIIDMIYPQSLGGRIASIYGGLDDEDCRWIDREWFKFRGFTSQAEIFDDSEKLDEALRQRDEALATIRKTQDALGTEESGDALVEVARNAHKVELSQSSITKMAIEVGAQALANDVWYPPQKLESLSPADQAKFKRQAQMVLGAVRVYEDNQS